MYSIWTQHLPDQKDKESFEREILSASRVLARLSEIISEREYSIDRSEVDMKTYDNRNWSERQAHKNGRRQEIYAMKDLINLDQQEG